MEKVWRKYGEGMEKVCEKGKKRQTPPPKNRCRSDRNYCLNTAFTMVLDWYQTGSILVLYWFYTGSTPGGRGVLVADRSQVDVT